MPKDQPGPERKDYRQIISGILHMLTSGRRWRYCPAAYHGLQPLVAARLLEGDADRTGQGWVGW